MNIYRNTENKYHNLSMGKFSSYYEKVDRMFPNVKFSFKGIFHDQNMSFINNYIENSVEENTTSRSDLFRIFVELAQNIVQNSLDFCIIEGRKIGEGILMIHEETDFYEIISGNPAKSNDAGHLAVKCDTINRSTPDDLRTMKREFRKMEEGEAGNAHIGLIKMGIISGRKIVYDIEPIDNETSFITLRIQINK